jgi:hypothetical protein
LDQDALAFVDTDMAGSDSGTNWPLAAGTAGRSSRADCLHIEVAVDLALDAAFPGAARRTHRHRDQRRASSRPPAANRKGDPEQALTDGELEGKFLELASLVIGSDRSRALLAQVWALDTSATLPHA